MILFLGERGLALQGSSERIGDVHNGNFLGILELVSHYDPILEDHLNKVKKAQNENRKIPHYLSHQSQNEFIGTCAELVRKKVLDEREKAKYFAILVDATPDASHTEQSTFILRYLNRVFSEGSFVYEIRERFLEYVDLSEKTGNDIAQMILTTMKEKGIDFEDCTLVCLIIVPKK